MTTTANPSWQGRFDAKKDRLAERAEAKAEEGQRLLSSPSFATVGKGLKALNEAKELTRRANARPAGIASDDEDAAAKLTAKIARLEAQRDHFKAVNKAVRAQAKNGEDAQIEALAELGVSAETAHGLLHPSWGKPGIQTWQLTNLGATIREAKRRLVEVTALQAAPALEVETEGFTLEEADGRFVLTFPERLPEDQFKLVRSHGFVWAPSRQAFVRKITANARHSVERLLPQLGGVS